MAVGHTKRRRAGVVIWALLSSAGCDASSHSAPSDAGTGAMEVFACSTPATPPSMGSCVNVSGSPDASASGAVACNPVTNASCPAGQACDSTVDSTGTANGFACYDGYNDAGLCQLCSTVNGLTCSPGLTCATAIQAHACARYCCTNADCGDAGLCETSDAEGRSLFSPVAPNLGLCAASH